MKAIASMLMVWAAATGAAHARSDPYRWHGKEIDRETVTITKFELSSQKALAEQAARLNIKFTEGEDGQGFGIVSRSEGRCTIYFVNPDKARTTTWAGHEMAHCFYGNWHK